MLLEDVLEGPEATTHMVQHGIEEHAYPCFMAGIHDGLQVLLRAEAAVDLRIVPRVIAMGVALEDRVQHQAADAELLHMVDPAIVHDLEETVRVRVRGAFLGAIVSPGSAGQPQRIDLIDKASFIPVHAVSPILWHGFLRPAHALRKAFGNADASYLVLCGIEGRFHLREEAEICCHIEHGADRDREVSALGTREGIARYAELLRKPIGRDARYRAPALQALADMLHALLAFLMLHS